MSQLLTENYQLLSVLSRFKIRLGFGDQSIEQVCQENQVDTETFLAIINAMTDPSEYEAENYHISTHALIEYLQNSHQYYLTFRLPKIKTQLEEALQLMEDKIKMLIIRYFDEYVDEVRKHMDFEENTVFAYVRTLLQNPASTQFDFNAFGDNHENIDYKLTELKNIIIKYCSIQSTNEIENALFSIFTCAQGLHSHNLIEDLIFIPHIIKLQKRHEQ